MIAYLQLPFAQHALIAATLVAVISGLIGPFVASRDMAFAVHGTAELSFTGAAAGLLIAGDAVGGALIGSLFVATAIGLLGERPRERNSAIGVILAAGLGLGVLLLSFYQGFATEATNILFGQIFGVSNSDILILTIIAVVILGAIVVIYRPLQFSSIDPEVAVARGVKTRAINFVFVFILALTVTEASQIVGTLLVLSLAITPAAAARHFSANPRVVSVLAIVFSLISADGGLLASLAVSQVKASVFISGISFTIYLIARLTRVARPASRRIVRVASAG
ncbi:MAG: zinc/manganese transport system permease protein [Microbacteriaceae bacterium]|jgi:zinc/manganese transport system permease protein|nr:zinc/manganese transport system permease protein [Microbacteriaceae bacterium]